MNKYTREFKNMLANYFLSIGFSVYKNGWFKGTNFSCPHCGKYNKFGINVGSDFYHCFRCDERGNLLDLAYELENVETKNELIKRLEKYKEGGYQIREESQRIDSLKEVKPLILPQGFKLLSQGTGTLANAARSYVKKRGFDPTKLSRKGWGYSNDKKYFGYLIMPFYQNREIIYFNARVFMGSGPRYLNPEEGKDASIGKSMLIYNEEALYMYNSVFLCEGILNAETISNDRGICSGGKSLSAYQISKILKSPVERVIICLDGDALNKSLELASKLVGHKLIKVVVFPKDKDINDLGKQPSLKLVYNTRYIRNMQQFNQLKNQLS